MKIEVKELSVHRRVLGSHCHPENTRGKSGACSGHVEYLFLVIIS